MWKLQNKGKQNKKPTFLDLQLMKRKSLQFSLIYHFKKYLILEKNTQRNISFHLNLREMGENEVGT